MLRGSCACGRVCYEIRGALIGPITHCHCWRCRKHSGASFGTTAGVKAADFSILTGAELLSSWESSPGIHRFFAGCCGSPIYKREDADPDEVRLRLGTLDSDPGQVAQLHYRVGSKTPWFQITDSLPQEAGGPAFGACD